MKKKYLTALLTLAILASPRLTTGNDIPLPTYPVEPTYSDVRSEKKEDKEQKVTGVAIEVMVILGTGDEVRGVIYLPESIFFKHYKNGLLYEKTVHPREFQSLTITQYNRIEESGNAKKKFYKFEPSIIEVKLSDGSIYRVDRIFSFLKSFQIETINGKTRLFTIFGDSFDPAKGWENVESRDLEYHKTRPHPASVKKIIFLKEVT